MTREEEKNHQSYLYIIKKCDTDEIPDWEDVELGFQAGMEYADEHPIHYDGKAYLYVLHKGVEQGKKEMIYKIKSLIKEWELHTSTEAKYRMEAYKELLDDFMKTMEE